MNNRIFFDGGEIINHSDEWEIVDRGARHKNIQIIMALFWVIYFGFQIVSKKEEAPINMYIYIFGVVFGAFSLVYHLRINAKKRIRKKEITKIEVKKTWFSTQVAVVYGNRKRVLAGQFGETEAQRLKSSLEKWL